MEHHSSQYNGSLSNGCSSSMPNNLLNPGCGQPEMRVHQALCTARVQRLAPAQIVHAGQQLAGRALHARLQRCTQSCTECERHLTRQCPPAASSHLYRTCVAALQAVQPDARCFTTEAPLHTHTQPLPQAQWGQNTCLSGSPYALQTGLALTLGFSCTPTNMTGSAVVRALQRNASTAAVLCCAAEHPLQPATKYKPTRQCVRRKTRASVSWRASTAKGSLQPQRRSPLTPSTSLKYEVSHKQAD